MAMTRHDVLRAALRQDFGTFLHRSLQTIVPGVPFEANWHLDVVGANLEVCRSGRIKRLIICLPPRHLKSICASVAFPAWLLGHEPNTRIICASYAIELALKHARDCRSIMQSSWYKDAFPGTCIDPAKSAEGEFVTTARGLRMAMSVGGVLTGRGCSYLIIDDPLKANEAYSVARREAVNDWFRTTAFSRLDDKADGVIAIVTQRLHPEDLIGHLLAEDPHGWTVLSLPATAEADETWQLTDGGVYFRRPGEVLHPARENAATLAHIKRTLGRLAYSAQYQQNPIPDDGELIRWDWFQRYRSLPEKGANDIVVQSWDTASKADELNDYSVCTTWLRRGDQHYLMRVDRVRLGYPELRRFIVTCASRDAADVVLIEDKGSGTSLIQDLRGSGDLHAIAVMPEGDKVMRMQAQSVRIEIGSVHLPQSAPWLDELRKEVLLFPRGRFDDQVDSVSQYLAWRDRRETWKPEDCFAIPLQSYAAMEAEFGPFERSPWAIDDVF